MDTFILRIYRQTDNDIKGLCEHVETGNKQQFQNSTDLIEIIQNQGSRLKNGTNHDLDKKSKENYDK